MAALNFRRDTPLYARALVATAISLFSGCTYGILYTNKTVPLVENMQDTPVLPDRASSSSQEIKDPFRGATFAWSSRAIGDAMKSTGMKKVAFGDLHTTSILGGIWKRTRVKLVGVRDEPLAAATVSSTDLRK